MYVKYCAFDLQCNLLHRVIDSRPVWLGMIVFSAMLLCLYIVFTGKRLTLLSEHIGDGSGIMLLNLEPSWTRIQITEPKKPRKNGGVI